MKTIFISFSFLIFFSLSAQEDSLNSVRGKAIDNTTDVEFNAKAKPIRDRAKAFENANGIKIQYRVDHQSLDKLGGLSEHLFKLFQTFTSSENVNAKVITGEFSADDLLGETFLRVQGALDRLRDEERAGAWIGRIARNVWVDALRRRTPDAVELEPDALPARANVVRVRLEGSKNRLKMLFPRNSGTFLTSRSPPDVCCQPSKRTNLTISSLLLTIRSTMSGVFSLRISSNNSVKAALAKSPSDCPGPSFSAATTS